MDIDMGKDRNVFSGRNFRLVFLGALVSELGALLYSFAVSFYILEISSNNAFLQGLYLALCGVAMLLFTPIGGVLGDRFNKARIMYVCDYIKGGMIILATIMMFLFREQMYVNIAISAVFAFTMFLRLFFFSREKEGKGRIPKIRRKK